MIATIETRAQSAPAALESIQQLGASLGIVFFEVMGAPEAGVRPSWRN